MKINKSKLTLRNWPRRWHIFKHSTKVWHLRHLRHSGLNGCARDRAMSSDQEEQGCAKTNSKQQAHFENSTEKTLERLNCTTVVDH